MTPQQLQGAQKRLEAHVGVLQTYSALRGLCRRMVGLLRPDVNNVAADQLAPHLHLIIDGLAFHLFQDRTITEWAKQTVRSELRAIVEPG